MSERHYSDVDEDLYFDEVDTDLQVKNYKKPNAHEHMEVENNPEPFVHDAGRYTQTIARMKDIIASTIMNAKIEDVEEESEDEEYQPTQRKKLDQYDAFTDEEDSDEDYDRRRTRKIPTTNVNAKIAEEELKVRARLEKLIAKRQEKLDLIERQIDVLSLYQNVKYFVRLLSIIKARSIRKTYLFESRLRPFAKILSCANSKQLSSALKAKTIDAKLEIIFSIMQNMKDHDTLETASALEIFTALLTASEITFSLDQYITFENIQIKPRFKLKFPKEKAQPKNKNEPKACKPSKKSLEKDFPLSVILNELHKRKFVIQFYNEDEVVKHPTFENNNNSNMIKSLKGSFFFGVLRHQRLEDGSISLSDVTVLELEESIWSQTLINQQVIGLKNTICEMSDQNSNLYKHYRDRIEELIKGRTPKSSYEFRISDHYVVRSVLKRGEILKDDAQPTSLFFMDQPIYLKSDVVELYGRVKWRMKGRQVRPGEQPIKITTSVYREDALIELFAEHQTDPFVLEVKDGKLPANEFGNIELWGSPLPNELVHLDYKGVWRAAKDLGMQYKQAVTGFDSRKGRNFAVKSGIVVFKKDMPKIMKRWKQLKKEIEEKEQVKKVDNALKKWKVIFKRLLIKKYMSRNYR